MSLINNPYNVVDAQELAIQEDNNYQTEQEMIYDMVSAYVDCYEEINVNEIVETLETVSFDEVEKAADRYRSIHHHIK